uniref:ARAD1D00506p n=1 Tax=Blastobotrys adeninivorans TaxID=409370 RepID=A0A060T7L9_BLAAD
MDVLSYQLEDADQFWDELNDISSWECRSNWTISQALRAYLRLAAMYMDQYLVSDEDLTKCIHELILSNVFARNRAYARRILISILTLEDELDIATKTLIGAVLLMDGRRHTSTLEMLEEEEASQKVIDTLWDDRHSSPRLHRLFLELLYEMCRVQKLRLSDLDTIREDFFDFLFMTVEKSGDDSDPYNLAVMKVLLALNEQYMIAELSAQEGQQSIVNKMFKVLKNRADQYRTFGENLVFLFNRGADVVLQLMMMKVFYLIFTTPETYEYIYLNDLKVLLSVIVRELNDLSCEEEKLRHTYLRILHPLLQNTQLKQEEYKRDQLVAVLESLASEDVSVGPLGEQDNTTQRLSRRCLGVPWLDYTTPVSTGVSTPILELTPATTISEPENSAGQNGPGGIAGATAGIITPVSSEPLPKKSTFLGLPKKKPPPRPSPRKLINLSIRNTSAYDVASVHDHHHSHHHNHH